MKLELNDSAVPKKSVQNPVGQCYHLACTFYTSLLNIHTYVCNTIKYKSNLQVTTIVGHNPYIYPCTTNHDCLFGTDNCVQTGCPTGVGLLDPSGWHCDCWTSSGGPPCDHDGDCCSNICGSDGFCEQGGRDGAVCMDCWGTTWDGACAAGCQCIPFEGYGYCQC